MAVSWLHLYLRRPLWLFQIQNPHLYLLVDRMLEYWNQSNATIEYWRDAVSSVEAKQSREKAEDVYEKEQEQIYQEPSFFESIMEARGKNSREAEK